MLKVGNGAILTKATFPSFLGAFRDLLLEVDFRFGFPLREPFEPLEPRDPDLDLDLRLSLDLRCFDLLLFLRSSWLYLQFSPKVHCPFLWETQSLGLPLALVLLAALTRGVVPLDLRDDRLELLEREPFD